MKFDKNLIEELIEEIRKEQHISPKIDDNEFSNYISEGMFNINDRIGERIDYKEDLNARSLLKKYVLYARYNRLAEFKELYEGDYATLHIKYNRDSNI